jgi:hypothetical protein
MLRLTIELWPFGDKRAAKLIKEVIIVNDGTNPNPIDKADYKVQVRDHYGTESQWKRKYIVGYPRRKYDAMYLTYLILRKLCHEEDVIPIDERAKYDKEAPCRW